MARGGNESDIRVGGMKLGGRFALATSAAVVVVMSIAGFLLYNATTQATAAMDTSHSCVRGADLRGKPTSV